ncbi:uncharacterized protein LOC119494862 [Sebastes umbrosus]|uniref:uncharacterized protein LOC119494862 n=1 Tax=Sebastes umbrosus TaxID=72105 RepID=UPI0018A0BDA2|nr:uncharacterized protein LOC119494862 [Sebastes umbrosus]
MSNKPPQQRSLQLENRFAPLLQDPGSRSDALDNLNSSHSRVRTKSNSEGKRLPGKLTTGPQTQTLIVGDAAVKDVKSMWSKDIKVLCFPKDMVSDLAERILDIVTAHPNVKNVVLHIGSNDVVKQQSEVLKRDFTGLLNTVSSVNAQVFISGPLPPIRRGVERFSRLLGLNTWLSTACKSHSVHFIDNFNFFWDRRHLFKADGLCLNKSGAKLFNSNLFYFLRHSSVPSAKDARQEESPLEEDTTQCARGPQGESFHPPPQASPGIQQRQEEASSSSLITLSPSSPLLEFTDHMKELVNAGTKLTPRPTPIFSPMIPPRGRPRTTLALSPQARHPQPPSPPQWNQPLSPQPDKDVPLQNVASTD